MRPPSCPQAPAALALSGGGLRAALFQQGCFLALAMRGELAGIKHVGAVSGGALAALALRQAHADVAGLAHESPRQRQLSIALHCERHLSRLAGHDLRGRMLLSWRTAASAVLFGTLGLTRRLAEEIRAAIGRAPALPEEPFELRIGVHALARRDAAQVVVGPGCDVGLVAAAAMAIPGLMEGLVVDASIGPVCDGGLDDKTALRVLLDSAQARDGILVLDASTPAALDPGRTASPLSCLLTLMERNAEALRSSQQAATVPLLGWVSLRDAEMAGCGFDPRLLDFLLKTRTDLDRFSSGEQLALSAAGFIATLHARGESRAAILEQAALLGTQEIATARGQQPYPLASLFEGVCRALVGEEAAPPPPTTWRGRLRRLGRLGRAPISDGLAATLERSSRREWRDLLSGRGFFVASGLMSAVWGLTIAGLLLFSAAMLLYLAVVEVGGLLGIGPGFVAVAAWLMAGVLAVQVASARVKAPDASPSCLRRVFGTVLLPALLPLVLAARLAVSMVQVGEIAWSLRYKQTTLGRIRGMFSIRDLPPRLRERPVRMWTMMGLLFLVLVANPWALAGFFAPVWTERFWHLDALGWFGWAIKYSPLHPATLAFLILEGAAGAIFAAWRGVRRLLPDRASAGRA